MNRYPRRESFRRNGALRRIPQHFADLVDGGIEVVLDIDKRVRPQPLLQLLPRYQFAGASSSMAST